MLTLIGSEQPRLAVYMDVGRSRPWRGLVWAGGVRDPYGAHWQTVSEKGIPRLIRLRELWRVGYFNLFDEEWMVLHGAGNFGDEASAPMEFNRRFTRTLMDHFAIAPEDVFSDEEAWARLGIPRDVRPPAWDMERFRASL